MLFRSPAPASEPRRRPMALAVRCPAAASPSAARAPFPNSSSHSHSQSAARLARRPAGGCRCQYYHGDGPPRSYDHIPKQFREENLKDGREIPPPSPPLKDSLEHLARLAYCLVDLSCLPWLQPWSSRNIL